MNITIRTVGNRQLYRSLYEAYDSETHHRSVNGAVRRIRQIYRDAADWRKATGQWGRVEITINGETLSNFDALNLIEADDDYALTRSWQLAVSE